ncbi:hypothetical protein [Pedobacter nutrimenti]|uniref:Uncharacterized protein n=1 Tax=Pedobacter nutrimenti TaxID=1241337 RepID=A0A318UNX5_9SPHI|nr:hypothetical protein [Pedobacter nutrimenti]PYF77240.1 hypothetical protein B0O44_101721 [Pedobacter nutrimenti]
MAKQIKPIKCPQCGSTDKTELRPDFFRCNNCNTEYFLDNDDININYNHNYTHSFGSATNKQARTVAIGAVIVFALAIIFGGILPAVLSSSTKSTYSTSESGKTVVKEKKYYASRYQGYPFVRSGTDQALILFVENRNYNSNSDKSKEGVYLTYYNVQKKEIESEQKLDDEKLSGSDVKLRKFSDGSLYLIVNKTAIYKIDEKDLKLKDAYKDLFSVQPELQVGVATIDFVYDDQGDGLVILTNDGKNYTYYPLVKKIYSKERIYDQMTGFKTLLPGAKDAVYYTFTSSSSEYPEEKRQLLKIAYKDNLGGPKSMRTSISWGKDYGGSGIFTDRDPYKKVLVGHYAKESGRILSWKDLTPGRLYFDPKVLYSDEHNLIIQFNNSAAPSSPKSIQKLNTDTGAVEWTVAIDQRYISYIIPLKSGFLASFINGEIMTINAAGKMTDNYKLD